MLRKKLIYLSIFVLTLLTFCHTVLALDPNKVSESITISYQVNASYIVTIPSSFTLSTDEQNYSVIASDVHIPEGKSLSVTMSTANYNNGYRLKLGSYSIPYSIKLNNVTQNSNSISVLNVKPSVDGTTKSATLSFQTTSENVKKATASGIYTDILTFDCKIN